MSTQVEQGQLVAQDTTRVLQRLFTGHIVGQPAMGSAPLLATVQAVTGTFVEVTVESFNSLSAASGTPSFLCYFQPVFGGTPAVSLKPPAGTKCYVTFPVNASDGYGVVVAFRSWPES